MKYIALFLALALFSCKSDENTRKIVVSGEGKVRVMPNQVILSLDVSFTEPRMADAVRRTQNTVDTVVSILKRYSKEQTDIKTSSISANKQYSYYRDVEKFIGFSAHESINFVLNDINKFTDLTGELLATRISSISSIQFNHSKADSIWREADLLAYDDALKSAEKLASRSQVKLGRLLFVSNAGSGDYQSDYDVAAYGNVNTFSKAYGGNGFKISPDVIEFRRTITSAYEIK